MPSSEKISLFLVFSQHYIAKRWDVIFWIAIFGSSTHHSYLVSSVLYLNTHSGIYRNWDIYQFPSLHEVNTKHARLSMSNTEIRRKTHLFCLGMQLIGRYFERRKSEITDGRKVPRDQRKTEVTWSTVFEVTKWMSELNSLVHCVLNHLIYLDFLSE